jgi:hypothetical protein
MQPTNEELAGIVKNSISFCDACRKAGKKPRGATLQWFRKRIKKLNLDTSHFLGRAAHSGARHTGSRKKKEWQQILVLGTERHRSQELRRAFSEYCLDKNIKLCCNECGLDSWNNKPIQLEIDHKNNLNSDNRPDNLRWICPNCHSQKHGH